MPKKCEPGPFLVFLAALLRCMYSEQKKKQTRWGNLFSCTALYWTVQLDTNWRQVLSVGKTKFLEA